MEADVEGFESSLLPQKRDECYPSPVNSVSKPLEVFSKRELIGKSKKQGKKVFKATGFRCYHCTARVMADDSVLKDIC